ncbi:MAG: hypothetical protein KIT73_10945 [Burkholderiales bacterium]|nr:hypothetical protein [Burkholderiales bacterium]
MRAAIGLLLMLMTAMVAAAGPTVLEVIDLRYRNAQEILPVLQPFVGSEGSISALGNQLVVRATPQNLAELRKVLDRIDRQPRRLMITVARDVDLDRQRSGAEVRGSIGGPEASVTLPGKSGDSPPGAVVGNGRAEARVYSSRSAGAERGGQRVQVLEGNSAFVALGQSAPVSTRRYVQTPQGPRVVESTQYRDAVTGFTARPRVNGDQVTVEIAGQRDQFTNPNTGATDIQRVDTVVSGRLGEWIELGGATGAAEFEQDGVTWRSSEAARDTRRWYLKVEVIGATGD